MHVLVLGGTQQARELADALSGDAVRVTTSLAGRTGSPRLPAGQVRVGGFGGPAALATWLTEHEVRAVIDATHPFADRISAAATAACDASGVELLRLVRPSWREHPQAHSWVWAPDHPAAAVAAAAAAAGDPRRRVFLTVGRQPVPHYVEPLQERSVLVRVAEPESVTLPAAWTLNVARGPFRLEEEAQFLRGRTVGVLVAKDAGGAATEPKLTAAAQAGVRVVMVSRPPSAAGVAEVGDVAAARRWVAAR